MDIDTLILEDHPIVVLQSPAKFALCTGVSIHTVRYWISEAIIPTERIGRRVLINIPLLQRNLLEAKIKTNILNKNYRGDSK
ncbi:hypothetical protein [Endozoicomonas sp. OPT23]|uniref:hypothetical protein n=1 Tax=Endozoicomonas sp. OPT23 TaxID=2072845 RepID=UPI00129A6873|nr:hypothetical protein [Endozoicomonas sp. OPT23]